MKNLLIAYASQVSVFMSSIINVYGRFSYLVVARRYIFKREFLLRTVGVHNTIWLVLFDTDGINVKWKNNTLI